MWQVRCRFDYFLNGSFLVEFCGTVSFVYLRFFNLFILYSYQFTSFFFFSLFSVEYEPNGSFERVPSSGSFSRHFFGRQRKKKEKKKKIDRVPI